MISFHKVKFEIGTSSTFHKTQISIIAGKANPSADKQKAPKSDINNPNLGIAAASKTKKDWEC